MKVTKHSPIPFEPVAVLILLMMTVKKHSLSIPVRRHYLTDESEDALSNPVRQLSKSWNQSPSTCRYRAQSTYYHPVLKYLYYRIYSTILSGFMYPSHQ